MQELGTLDHGPLGDGSRAHNLLLLLLLLMMLMVKSCGGSAVEAQVHQCSEADIGLSPLAEAHDLVEGLSICEMEMRFFITTTATTAAVVSIVSDMGTVLAIKTMVMRSAWEWRYT